MNARNCVQYEDLSSKFLIRNFNYQRQYSHLYAHRLSAMTLLLKESVAQKWGSEYPIYKLCDLREDQKTKCIIIGTTYKHQVHKPSILREISEENQLTPQPARLHYADTEDMLILEDELQRVRLQGKVDVGLMSTGIVCAALGTVEDGGRFEVEDIVYYEAGIQRPLVKGEHTEKLLVLASGLDQLQSYKYAEALNLFQHWLGGHFCTDGPLTRLIVAGDSIRSEPEQLATTVQSRQPTNDASHVVKSMRSLDAWFTAWSRVLPVDVMPGAHDPVNCMLPQQPFHRCMFPQAVQHASFRSVPNPYACIVEDRTVVGTAGQNVADLLRCTDIKEPLHALRSTLVWSHLAPSAPDTLPCFPYIDSDPLVLQECPHIYYAGNCCAFATELHTSSDRAKSTRLICVPRFSQTQSVVVVDLSNLECHEVCFAVDSE